MSMLQGVNSYLQNFVTLRDWAKPFDMPNLFLLIIHTARRSSDKHFHCYNGLQSSEIAAIIPRAKNGIVGFQDILIRRGGRLNQTGAERIDTIPLTHRSYDPHT